MNFAYEIWFNSDVKKQIEHGTYLFCRPQHLYLESIGKVQSYRDGKNLVSRTVVDFDAMHEAHMAHLKDQFPKNYAKLMGIDASLRGLTPETIHAKPSRKGRSRVKKS